jgi:predicted DNA-binding transcriptional regulator AlpA
VEARAFANSDGTTGQLRLGRVQGLREAGVLAGYWRKRDSAAAAELVQHRYRLSKIRDVLLRGDEVKLWKVTDVAEFLGVSTQRVDQLALAGRFPAPSGRLGRARYWERSDVEAWAESNWWAGDGRRWRHRATGKRGSPRRKHPGAPGARVGRALEPRTSRPGIGSATRTTGPYVRDGATSVRPYGAAPCFGPRKRTPAFVTE